MSVYFVPYLGALLLKTRAANPDMVHIHGLLTDVPQVILRATFELDGAAHAGLAADLGNKLPPELLRGEEPLAIDESFLAAILDEVGPSLRVRLTSPDSTE